MDKVGKNQPETGNNAVNYNLEMYIFAFQCWTCMYPKGKVWTEMLI